MSPGTIYLDNHATTRCDPRVVREMLPCFGEIYGNPSSRTHAFGQAAADLVDDARRRVAAAIGARPREIVFTSGATESNRLAVEAATAVRKRCVSSAIEHKSLLHLSGPVVRVPVGADGIVDPAAVDAAIEPDVGLVAVMAANNEIGTIQPVGEIAAICRTRGVTFAIDATAAIGRVPVDVGTVGCDFLSFSGHKIYGPKGVGALFVREGRGFQVARPGTVNVPGVVGLAAALELCLAEREAESVRLRALRDRLLFGLKDEVGGILVNGDLTRRLPGSLSVSVAGVDGPALIPSIEGIAVSSGSACGSGSPETSHVLDAIGRSRSEALASIRFCLGRWNGEECVAAAVQSVAAAVRRLRAAAGRRP